MEFRDLKKQYQALKEKIDNALISVVQSGSYIMGQPVLELEKQLAQYVGVKHCITSANGTDALTLVLMAWGIGAKDAVFVPDFTFFSSGEVVAYEGATPVFVDVDERTFNIDVEKLEEAIIRVKTEKQLTPKAVISVDLFGLPANNIKIEKLAEKYNLLLLEDAAQGFGGKIGSQKACSFGDAAITSFFPAKPLGCYGDGGAVFTNDDIVAKYILSAKYHGKGINKYDNTMIGINSRLDTIQAAVLSEKFKAFVEYELDAVNLVYNWYNKRLENVVKVPLISDGFYSSFAQYTIILENNKQRDELSAFLKANLIPSMVYYIKPMHLQTAFAYLGYKTGDFPVSEMLCECVLSLPMHPYLTEDEVDLICNTIKKFKLLYPY